MKKTSLYRGLFYFLGLLILALGLTLNTKTGLGVSPIISVSYCTSMIWNLNFGNMTLILYSFFVVVELILHARQKDRLLLLKDILQIPLSLLFTRFLNLFSYIIPDLKTAYPDQFAGSLIGRILFLFLAIVLTGVGAAMSLNMRVIPNPGDGIVQAIADCIHKSTGFTKNCFDLFCIITTIVISVLCSGHLVGIGLGTVFAVIGVGRSIAAYNHFCFHSTARLAGLEK